MVILVTNQQQIERDFTLIDQDIGYPTVVISITSSNGLLLCQSRVAEIPWRGENYIKEVMFMQFDDVDREVPGWELKLFNEEDAHSILDFVERYKDHVIMCQCEAGISRSAGVAAALSKIHNDKDEEFFKQYRPNMLVYRTILSTYYGERS